MKSMVLLSKSYRIWLQGYGAVMNAEVDVNNSMALSLSVRGAKQFDSEM